MSKEITIDATGRAIGRIATEAAIALRGKDEPNFERYILSGNKVKIVNASKMKIAPTKLTGKTYRRYTGYPGGLKERTLENAIEKKGYAEPLKLAIYGMLPANKLRAKMMTNLTITD